MALKLDPLAHHHACCAAHAASPEDGLRAAEELCAREGQRLTPQRRAVLKGLLAARKPLGAYDLIEILREGGGRAPAPIVIYRALDFLKELGLIHRLETLNAFIACPHRHGTHERVTFLICEACRHVDEIIAPELNTALATLAGRHDFRATRQVVELAGKCRNCG